MSCHISRLFSVDNRAQRDINQKINDACARTHTHTHPRIEADRFGRLSKAMGPLGTWYRVKVFIEFVFFAHQKVKEPTSRPTRRTDSWTTSLKTVGSFQSVRFGLHDKVFRCKCLRTNKAKRRTSRTGPAPATSGSTTPIRSGPLHERRTKI